MIIYHPIGRSAFRSASRQSRRAVQGLYNIVQRSDDARLVRMASEQLKRWGFSPDTRCMLTCVCDTLLIKTPGHEDDVFCSLDFRDRMHGLCIFIHRQICESLERMKLPQATRILLDRRLAEIGLMRALHDPRTGRSYRVQRSLFTEAHMTASDRVCTLFLLPHVIGHQAMDFPELYREPLLTAISWTQIFIIATRGGRSYNERELREIFGRGWVICFGALERIHHISFQNQYDKKMKRHRSNPAKNKQPKKFQRTLRYDIVPYIDFTSSHTLILNRPIN